MAVRRVAARRALGGGCVYDVGGDMVDGCGGVGFVVRSMAGGVLGTVGKVLLVEWC